LQHADAAGNIMQTFSRSWNRVKSRLAHLRGHAERLAPFYRAVLGPDSKVFSFKPSGQSKGNVLLSYETEGFLRMQRGQPLSNGHTNTWESWQIAQTWLQLGYAVDVISFLNRWRFWPRKRYDVIIDTRWNLERFAPLCGPDCVKILHVDLAHLLFSNVAEFRRLLDLQQRKGVTLMPRRVTRLSQAIEVADCATVLGNEFTMGTFRYANKPMYPIPLSQPVLYDWSEDKNFEDCRRNYLWFGSGGMVKKGLDLVLETFAKMPQYSLTVCGPVHKETDFVKAYHKELFETPNIRVIGWIDIGSPEWIELTKKCVGLIYPSCCEGQCGAVITCMHAGLIPVASYESGVDLEGFGVTLKDCSIEEITRSIEMISSLPAEELRRRSRKAWEFARANHTRERFAEEYRKAAVAIIERFAKDRSVPQLSGPPQIVPVGIASEHATAMSTNNIPTKVRIPSSVS
jgi:glycosyltransferase involved in cell wall biosynthesis